MFEKILIANRGEIACRVAHTARRMGVRTVAVYSDADAHAKHVAACDEAVHIGGSAPTESYLQWERILAAARDTGAQAIHPGYGFLAENEQFAQACADAGLVFIGPPASAIAAMGLKAESKRLMGDAGVPLVPGYQGEDQDPQLLHREADGMGYPVLIKASAGGGGKGMREVHRSEDFMDALESCKREAVASFGNDAVLVEKLVQQPRHIEIQIFADSHGNCVHLFERDCSTQRRHQKVLEEAPAPGMTPELRERMGAAAVAAARAVGYVGAGTVEFIVEQLSGGREDQTEPRFTAGPPQGETAPPGGSEPRAAGSVGVKFYFMEMNTRLQVEHPVTEAITGQDLVEWQLRVAAGQPLPLQQDELAIHGHAIEARICAENPDRDFLPATGRIAVYRRPPHTRFERGAVRVDDGVREGDSISPFYDPMIAKLIVWGETRQQALGRMEEALAQTRIVGLHTNLRFLRHAVATDSFRQARLDTGLIQREANQLFGQDRLGVGLVTAAAVAHAVLQEQAAETDDPFSRADGFRSHGVASRRIDYQYHDETVVAKLRYLADGLQLQVGEEAPAPLSFSWCLDADGQPTDEIDLRHGAQRQVVQVLRHGAESHVFGRDGAASITELDPLALAGGTGVEGGGLAAPMPGKVVSFAVQVGDRVSKGQPLAVMEAMKMEHAISAPADGVVGELLYAPGDQVGEGEALLRLEETP